MFSLPMGLRDICVPPYINNLLDINGNTWGVNNFTFPWENKYFTDNYVKKI